MSEHRDTPRVTTGLGRGPPIIHECDWAEDDPALAVVRAVAVADNREPTEHRPLYHAVDTDALNELFDGRQSPSVEVSFTYAQFDVIVSGTGTVAVHPADDGAVST